MTRRRKTLKQAWYSSVRADDEDAAVKGHLEYIAKCIYPDEIGPWHATAEPMQDGRKNTWWVTTHFERKKVRPVEDAAEV